MRAQRRLYALSCHKAGMRHGPAGRDGRVRGHRGPRGRRAGAGRARSAGVQRGRPARQGGVGSARAGARRAGRIGPGAAGAPHHRQSRARRPAEGRQPLRPADRARADGGDRRDPVRCAVGLHGAGRTRPRRLDRRGRGRAAGGDRRQCARRRPDLPGRLRRRGRLGEPRDGDRRRRLADPARQPFPRHAGAVAAAAEDPRGRQRAGRPQGHQGPGERQARARSRGRRRPQPADGRAARRRQVDAGGAAADHPAAADAGRTARSAR